MRKFFCYEINQAGTPSWCLLSMSSVLYRSAEVRTQRRTCWEVQAEVQLGLILSIRRESEEAVARTMKIVRSAASFHVLKKPWFNSAYAPENRKVQGFMANHKGIDSASRKIKSADHSDVEVRHLLERRPALGHYELKLIRMGAGRLNLLIRNQTNLSW